MLKKIKYFIIIIVLIFILSYSLLNPDIIIKDILNALVLFITKVFPSIFFFYTIIDLLINYQFTKYLHFLFDKLFTKIFHISGYSTFIIIMSMLSGFPSGSKYIVDFLEKKKISTNSANYLLTFTHFSNPLFILGMISSLYDIKTAYLVLIIHFLANFILAFIIRPKKYVKEKMIVNEEKYSFDICLKNSFIKSFKILTLILGNTLFFYTISDILTYNIKNEFIKIIIYGFFDITKGLNAIDNLNNDKFIQLLLILSFISFGGININFQVKQIISKEKLDYKYFLMGRISSLAISIILLMLSCLCFTV